MIIGALFACFTLQGLDQSGFGSAHPQFSMVIAILVAGVTGMIFSPVARLRGHQPEGRPDHRRHGAEPVCARLRRCYDLGDSGSGLTTISIPSWVRITRDTFWPCPGGRPQLLEQPHLQVFLS